MASIAFTPNSYIFKNEIKAPSIHSSFRQNGLPSDDAKKSSQAELKKSYADAVRIGARSFATRFVKRGFQDSHKRFSKIRCFRCGEWGHFANFCRNARVCFRCHSTGHISTHCFRSPQQKTVPTSSRKLSTQDPLSSSQNPTFSSLSSLLFFHQNLALLLLYEVEIQLIRAALHSLHPSLCVHS